MQTKHFKEKNAWSIILGKNNIKLNISEIYQYMNRWKMLQVNLPYQYFQLNQSKENNKGVLNCYNADFPSSSPFNSSSVEHAIYLI